MTTEQIAELKRLAEAATPEWKHYEGTGINVISTVELGKDTFRDRICEMTSTAFKGDQTIHDAKFIAACNPAAILELLNTLDRAVEMAKYYATELPWEESERKRYMWDDEETGAPVFLKEKVRSRLACHSMTKARDFLASLEGKKI